MLRHFSTSTKTFQLYKTPSKWANLPPEQILALYKERSLKLVGQNKFNQDELNALLSTSKYTGIPEHEIKRIYTKGEVGVFEILNEKYQDNYNPPKFQFDEYPENAQQIIRDHREQREYNRIAAYEMPHLVKYRQEYKPTVDKPLKFKFVKYLGESDYKANQKVSLVVKLSDLKLDEKQQHKFKVLSGTRFNHDLQELKMSYNKLGSSLQNSKELSQQFSRLLKESKDLSKDDFSDIPLDLRYFNKLKSNDHNKKLNRYKLKFPEEWKRPEDAPKERKSVLDLIE
ncbi:hypothetical protein WICMUC_004729 [Wickerhamomyces mucosus]|uniref:Small ribosomal subunit protein mS35 mitochondrial conserved domain-containing protein n=1 Tax=Wickerhamomyces mucosus TaxID=1378264 RepID=A0A9P8PG30_9ASCO|nr:hypothetical protein WICMUC_004729 [Wickerhamomyces mucosus]